MGQYDYSNDVNPYFTAWSMISWHWHNASINSLRPSQFYIQQTRASLVHIIACSLCSNKPLSKPMLTYSQWDIKKRNLKVFMQENEFGNVVSKMVAILPHPQCLNYISQDIKMKVEHGPDFEGTKDTHISHSLVSYGLSVVGTVAKLNHIIMANNIFEAQFHHKDIILAVWQS